MSAGDLMMGMRRHNVAPNELKPGDYSRWAEDDNNWYACCPGPDDLTANLSSHTVTEHENGTITVSPSILVKGGQGKQWHGWLERGQWREA